MHQFSLGERAANHASRLDGGRAEHPFGAFQTQQRQAGAMKSTPMTRERRGSP